MRSRIDINIDIKHLNLMYYLNRLCNVSIPDFGSHLHVTLAEKARE